MTVVSSYLADGAGDTSPSAEKVGFEDRPDRVRTGASECRGADRFPACCRAAQVVPATGSAMSRPALAIAEAASVDGRVRFCPKIQVRRKRIRYACKTLVLSPNRGSKPEIGKFA